MGPMVTNGIANSDQWRLPMVISIGTNDDGEYQQRLVWALRRANKECSAPFRSKFAKINLGVYRIQIYNSLPCFSCSTHGLASLKAPQFEGNLEVQNLLYESSVDCGRIVTPTSSNSMCNLQWRLAARENRILCVN